MKKLNGNIGGLKSSQVTALERLHLIQTAAEYVISPDLADDLCRLSGDIKRQVGVLINRQGIVVTVIVGDHDGLMIPDLSEYRMATGRLKGLRLVHTHLHEEPLSPDDLTDLSLLRLDLIAAITLDNSGKPLELHIAHILPGVDSQKSWQLLGPFPADQLNQNCMQLIQSIENELGQKWRGQQASHKKEKALLVSVTTASRKAALDSLNELEELAWSCGIDVVDRIVQHRKQADPRFLLGSGKLQELSLLALQQDVTLLIFDQEMNASQIRSITDQMDIKVIDRTQLILDIFAQRAKSREGKLQVELAQLKYMLPRLVTKNTAMSRLTGGIGGRGPGETKLEINRRRARDRINRLEKSLADVILHRKQQKSRRQKKGLPVISIIGYTNAGKSTLLNTLTQSQVLAEQRMFATLDPSSRRLRFPRDIDVIITDTVGFIRDLPKELQVAFRATLEELESADILLHVIDVSNERFEDQIQSVERILEELNLQHIPTIRVLNKMDRIDSDSLMRYTRLYDGTPVSALKRATLMPLIQQLEGMIQTRLTQPIDSFERNADS
ncbi:MAG: GTPase HflX [Desulfatirhabdiaceae bacterium]